MSTVTQIAAPAAPAAPVVGTKILTTLTNLQATVIRRKKRLQACTDRYNALRTENAAGWAAHCAAANLPVTHTAQDL